MDKLRIAAPNLGTVRYLDRFNVESALQAFGKQCTWRELRIDDGFNCTTIPYRNPPWLTMGKKP
jgi:hypothetical protein